MNKEEFRIEVEKLGIVVTDSMMEQLDLFYHLLVEWNEKINLTAIIDEESVYLKHFYDSLTLVKASTFSSNLSLCDVGSGAGFPGIVLKIFFPQLKITLVDSLRKRVIYLNDVIEKLGLQDIHAEHFRMEDFSRLHEEEFDLITARAVSKLSILCEISVRSLKIGGNLIFMKANCEEELEDISSLCHTLGLDFPVVERFVLPIENSNRSLVSFLKEKKTLAKYPRNIDKIKKNPL